MIGRPINQDSHELEHSNLFLIPLDDEERWFRFHHLFGAVAGSTLEMEQPGRAAMLHGRAADWLSENGHIDAAIEHALAAGDGDRAASLVQASWFGISMPDLEAPYAAGCGRCSPQLPMTVRPRSSPRPGWLEEEMDRRLARLSTMSSEGSSEGSSDGPLRWNHIG